MSHWRVDRHGPIVVCTFHHPPRNSMTFAAMTELHGLVEKVAADDSATALVIASDVPGWFVLHGDLEDLVKLGRGEPVDGDLAAWPATLTLFESMPQIVVAAIDGRAGGGGLEMTLACTMRVVGPDAALSFVEVPLGLIPGGGGTQRLPRLVGPGRAAELILSGRTVRGDEAVTVGLAEHHVADGPFLDGVLAWLAPIAARPAGALAAAKRAILDGLALPLDEGLAREAELVGPLLVGEQAQTLMAGAIAKYATTPADQDVEL
ncbi:enoyl-CoA hydratase/isomerase family protein [Jatrophihabitans fulvus]